jgi:hypothetical protein
MRHGLTVPYLHFIPNERVREDIGEEKRRSLRRLGFLSAGVIVGLAASDGLLGLGGPRSFVGGRVPISWRWRRHPRIRSSPPYPCSGGAPSASGRRMESCVRWIFSAVRFWYLLVWFQVSFFRSMVVIIDDGCCSSTLVFWGLSTTTFCLSTTTSSIMTRFARFH